MSRQTGANNLQAIKPYCAALELFTFLLQNMYNCAILHNARRRRRTLQPIEAKMGQFLEGNSLNVSNVNVMLLLMLPNSVVATL